MSTKAGHQKKDVNRSVGRSHRRRFQPAALGGYNRGQKPLQLSSTSWAGSGSDEAEAELRKWRQ